MIILIAVMKAKPGHADALEVALKSVFPKVREEPGTLQYVLHRSTSEPQQFLFYEKYADQAALDAHGATPYLNELFETIGDLLAEKPSLAIYEEIAAINR